MLLGAASAKAAPSVSFKCTPGAARLLGLVPAADVRLALDCAARRRDVDAAVENKSFTTDTTGTHELLSEPKTADRRSNWFR